MTYPRMTHHMAERTAGNDTTPRTYVIEVEHDPRQSYARAVVPHAMRAARNLPPVRGGWALVDVEHGEATTTEPLQTIAGAWRRTYTRAVFEARPTTNERTMRLAMPAPAPGPTREI